MLQVCLSPEVQKAIDEDWPIVALESTIISHGLPWPQNMQLASDLEAQVRRYGNRTTPATIAMIDGIVRVGLSLQEIEHIARSGRKMLKLSSFDLPVAAYRKLSGTTTVAGTLAVCELVGISVFATGGIGGVHRDYSTSLDISQDLESLRTYSAIVVSAGAKAILDLPATHEYLETKGVLVLGWKTKEFPAFYYGQSGISLNYFSEDPADVVGIFRLIHQGSLLLVNPPPLSHEIPRDVIEPLLKKICDEAGRDGIRGKELTPFLLSRLDTETKGKSTACNLALVRNNVQLACQIAGEVCD